MKKEKKINKHILNSEERKKDKQTYIKNELSNILPNQISSNLSRLMIGFKADLGKIFGFDKSISISFNDSNYDEIINRNSEILDDNIETLETIKTLYDTVFLRELFNGKDFTNISKLMIDKYNKHHDDLKKLKNILKNNITIYNEIFINNNNNCKYTQFIKNHLNYDDFRKILIKALDEIEKNLSKRKKDLILSINEIKKELEDEAFLPRITSVDNGRYPYQLNEQELISIIENYKDNYPFLGDMIDGTYKLVKLLKFRIPYYVGPLNQNSKYAWLVKNSNDKITPFNFDKVVNKSDSAQNFIIKMISNCTYLLNEKVIPANSILYSKYKVLNELKQIKIICPKRTDRLTVELQNKIYNELFLKTKGVIKDEKFKEYLKSLDEFEMYQGNFQIKGYSDDEKFANNMNSYIDFFGNDGIFSGTNYNVENAEEIIKWVTIFEDKEILEKKLNEKYHLLNERKIKKILALNYKGWSRLSEKLLTEKWYLNKENNKSYSIMDLLIETDKNFEQIINDKKYKFQKFIKKNNNYKNTNKINYDLVSELSTSPANKKAIYNSLRVIDEIVNYIGYKPKRISIEMAREKEKNGKRSQSRKQYIQNLYSKCSKKIENYNILNKELKNYDKYNNITPDQLLLYFMQEGKCLYCGKPLDIDKISTDCEIDHIIPRTLIKDDSIDNRALVHKEHNQEKSANVILPKIYRNHQNIEWWNKLLKNKLISQKKFTNLIRSNYKDEDIEGFISRQLVEVRQITKHVANILENIYKGTEIIYLKANLSSNYRKKYHMFKYRDLNDYHHAHDAYLASVLGEYIKKLKYTNYETFKEKTKLYLDSGKYYELKYGYPINSTEDDIYDTETKSLIFDSKKFNQTVINTLYQNDIIINKKTEIKTGEFYNETLYPKSHTPKGFRIKDNLPTTKYGYYKSLNPSYISLVKYGDKQKLIGIPIVIDLKSKKCEDIKIEYVRNLLKLKDNQNLVISSHKIPFNTLINYKGQLCSIVGASDKIEVCNALEFNIDKEHQIKWKYTLHKILNNNSLDKIISIAKSKDINYTEDMYREQVDEIVQYIINKMESKYLLYKNLVPRLKSVLNEKYKNLSTEDKEKLIKELLNLLKFNSKNANLKFLDNSFGDNVGRANGLTISDATIINKSITGIRSSNHELQDDSNF